MIWYYLVIGFKIFHYCLYFLSSILVWRNKYQINFEGFEEGEKYASTNAVEHTPGFDMEFIGSDMILFGSYLILLGSRVQYISVLLVSVLINFGVKKQVSKISFKVLKKEKNVHLPSPSNTLLDLIWKLLDLISYYLDMIWY